MNEFCFKAIGTKWRIVVDGDEIKEKDSDFILSWIDKFEKQFSRFLPNSEVNSFSQASPGVYSISNEFLILLEKANELRSFTNGKYDPAVSELLERAGYDADYSLEESANTKSWLLPNWYIKNSQLQLEGPTKFDLGGTGKGYCIDKVAQLMIDCGYQSFFVEAGGDMYATQKADNSAWKAAVTYPGKPELAVSTVELKNQALAVSDSFRRRWQNWHHIVDPQEKQSIEEVIGVAAIASTAWNADCVTSALFLTKAEAYAKICQHYDASYLVFLENEECIKSENWPGVLFTD